MLTDYQEKMPWKIFLFMLNSYFTNGILAEENEMDPNLIKISVRIDTTLPNKPEAHLYASADLPDDDTYYIVAFEPHASMEKVHHMVARGCNYLPIKNSLSDYQCPGNEKVMYAWARGAPSLKLPEGVGFKVGKDSDVKSIILQIHYGNMTTGDKDESGIYVYLTKEKLKKEAGVLLLATYGIMGPGTTVNFEVACKLTEDVKFYPFAFRTHTHRHGVLVSGYNIFQEPSGDYNVQLIGSKNPILPQFFYPVENKNIVIQKGNILAGRCTMRNDESRPVFVGSTSDDEMCNFYIMYHVEDGKFPRTTCFSFGPPFYYWSYDSMLTDIPMPE